MTASCTTGSSTSIDNAASPLADDRFSVEALAGVLAAGPWAAAKPACLKVAFSGGLDSHVLLHALARVRDTHPWPITAIHVNHGLHSLADDWQQHCQTTCDALGIKLIVERVTVAGRDDLGIEAAARQVRYQSLARHIDPGDALLTAHHQDDQAETLLLQLLRGAGVHGLAGMPAFAPFVSGWHVRPLLGFRRTALERYAREHELQWIEDSSNLDTRISRNFLRYQVVPLLEHHWPAAVECLARSARHAAAAAATIDEQADTDLRVAETGVHALRLSVLARLSPARRANALRAWLRRRHGRTPDERTLNLLLAQTSQVPATRHMAVRLGNDEVRRHRDELAVIRFERPSVNPVMPWDMIRGLPIPGSHYHLRAVATVGAGLSRERVSGKNVEIRWRAGGEQCRPLGHAHRRVLKKLLQESAIAPWRRRGLPLIYVDGELAAIADRWVCEPFACAPGEAGILLMMVPAP